MTTATQTVEEEVLAIGRQAREASHTLSRLGVDDKNRILNAMADEIDARRTELQAANAQDLAAGREAGLTDALLDRLELTDARIKGMSDGIREIAELPDPVGEQLNTWTRPNGLEIQKMRVPIGVIGIIYESRPKRDRGCGGSLFQSVERGDPPRGQGGGSLQSRHRGRAPGGRIAGGTACQRDPV